MRASLLPRYVRALFLFPAVAGAVVLASCADRQPTGPTMAGPLFTGTSSGSDNCGLFTVPLAGGKTTEARLCASHDDSNWYINIQLRDPANAAGSVLRLLAMKNDEDVLIWDEKIFTQSTGLTDWYRNDENGDGFDTSHRDRVAHGSGERSGSTYYLTIPRDPTAADSPDPQDLALIDQVQFRVQLEQHGTSGYYPSSDDWKTYTFAGGGTGPGRSDDPAKPDLTVITNKYSTVVVRTFAGTDEYRLQLPDWCGEDGDLNTACYTTFYDLPAGAKVVASALGGNWFTDRSQRLVAPYYFEWAARTGNPNQEGYVFVNTGSDFGVGESKQLIPANYYDAFTIAKALNANGTIQITLGSGNTSLVKCYFASGVVKATVHAVHPLTGNVPSGFDNLGNLQPGLSPFVDGYSGTDPCEVYVNNTLPTVLAAQDNAGNKYNILVGPGETEAVMVPIAAYYASRYVVDPWNDASPQDLGQVTYGAIRDANGDETPTFSVTTQVRGTVTNKKGETFNRSTLELLVGGQTVKITVYCSNTTNWECKAQEVSKGWGTKVAVSGFVTVDATGSRGYTRINVNLSGLVSPGTEVRLRVRTGDNGSDNDFAPNDKLTDLANHIQNGYAIYTFGGSPGQSWKLTF